MITSISRIGIVWLTIRNTSKTRARWDHPAVPPNARSVAVAVDRTEGDIITEGVGGDSGESEGRTALRGRAYPPKIQNEEILTETGRL